MSTDQATVPQNEDVKVKERSILDEVIDATKGIDMRAIWQGSQVRYKSHDNTVCQYSIAMLATVLGGAFKEASKDEQLAFITYCANRRLDPVRKQVYFIRYRSGEAPSFVTNWEVFIERAQMHPNFDGYENGIVWRIKKGETWTMKRGKPCDYVPDDDHQIAGGWAKVYVKGHKKPVSVEVPFEEMVGMSWDRESRQKVPTPMWRDKPTTMSTKTPTSRAMRLAFPDKLGGLYTEHEIMPVSEPEPRERVVPASDLDELAERAEQE